VACLSCNLLFCHNQLEIFAVNKFLGRSSVAFSFFYIRILYGGTVMLLRHPSLTSPSHSMVSSSILPTVLSHLSLEHTLITAGLLVLVEVLFLCQKKQLCLRSAAWSHATDTLLILLSCQNLLIDRSLQRKYLSFPFYSWTKLQSLMQFQFLLVLPGELHGFNPIPQSQLFHEILN
jgi:hypothetical protein